VSFGCYTHFRLLSFLAGEIPSKSPELPVDVLLVMAPEALPDAGFGVGVNNETLAFVLLMSPCGDCVLAVPPGLFPTVALERDIELNNPLYGGFVSAFPPLNGLGDGDLSPLPLDPPAGNPNNPPLVTVLPISESETFGVVAPGQWNNPVLEFVLPDCGEGVMSFRLAGTEGVSLLEVGFPVRDGTDRWLKIFCVVISLKVKSEKTLLRVEPVCLGVFLPFSPFFPGV
jgi:hypothetical protein